MIELLVVIALIGILSAIIFGNLFAARARAKTIATINQLKQFSIALELYALDHDGQYPNPSAYGEASNWCTWDVGGSPSTTFSGDMTGDPGVDRDGDGYSFLDPLVDPADNGVYISNGDYAQIMNSDTSFVYGTDHTWPEGPCQCVIGGNLDYILFAYDLYPVAGITDQDPCDDPAIIAPNCRTPGNTSEPEPNTYCILKKKS